MYLNFFSKKMCLTFSVVVFALSFVSNSFANESDRYVIELSVKQAGNWPIGDTLSNQFRSQEAVFKTYLKNSRRGNYKDLAKELDVFNLRMTLKCQLKGGARDAWFNWFSNHLELIYQLKRASKKESENLLMQIESSFENFHKKLKLN